MLTDDMIAVVDEQYLVGLLEDPVELVAIVNTDELVGVL